MRSSSLKWLALSAALGLVLVAVFLTWGGATLNRFQQEENAGATASDFSDFRGAIQLDALRFSAQSPLLGVGLGNFEPLFSFSRVDSINGNRAIHPESDWLWLACEMGWPAVAFLTAGYIWWLRRSLPLENKSGESMRRALIVAVLIFAVHGFVDVSGHRPGSLWVALLLAGLALPPRAEAAPSRTTPFLFRGLGLLLLVLAAWWGGSIEGYSTPPTAATLARLKTDIISSAQSPAAIIRAANAALRIAPLDWSLYFLRGQAEIALQNETDRAVADFTTARRAQSLLDRTHHRRRRSLECRRPARFCHRRLARRPHARGTPGPTKLFGKSPVLPNSRPRSVRGSMVSPPTTSTTYSCSCPRRPSTKPACSSVTCWKTIPTCTPSAPRNAPSSSTPGGSRATRNA